MALRLGDEAPNFQAETTEGNIADPLMEVDVAFCCLRLEIRSFIAQS
jgi:hypothetical protein